MSRTAKGDLPPATPPVIKPKSRSQLVVRIAVIVSVLAVIVWALGFLRFIDQVPRADTETVAPSDAIAVLTGGSKRLAVGFRLLDAGVARMLFISGVHSDVTADKMLDLARQVGADPSPDLIACCVTLGFHAENTRGNAEETAEWARTNAVETLVLVTSNYHMPRSLLEFSRAMPEVTLRPYAVVAEAVMLEDWWRWPGSLRLLVGEYHKFILAGLRGLL